MTVAFMYLLSMALMFGGTAGWITGDLMGRILHETKNRITLDILAGTVGFLLGTAVSFTGESSLEQEWLNGKLVYKNITGYTHYWLLFVIVGAAGLVIVIHLLTAMGKKFARRNIRTSKP